MRLPHSDEGKETRAPAAAAGRSSGRLLRAAAVLLAAALTAGCAGYQVGSAKLFRPEIQTVHVPVFRSNSLRRHLGERLTEAVARKIETTTPYRVAAAGEADSTLQGRFLYDRKAVLADDRFDYPRVIDSQLLVAVQWQDRNGLPLMQLNTIVLQGRDREILQSETFIPESGQSLAVAQQEALDRLADQIVAQMENRW